jgi:hypothetical protein
VLAEEHCLEPGCWPCKNKSRRPRAAEEIEYQLDEISEVEASTTLRFLARAVERLGMWSLDLRGALATGRDRRLQHKSGTTSYIKLLPAHHIAAAQSVPDRCAGR